MNIETSLVERVKFQKYCASIAIRQPVCVLFVWVKHIESGVNSFCKEWMQNFFNKVSLSSGCKVSLRKFL